MAYITNTPARDIKPGDIIIGSQGFKARVKVTDIRPGTSRIVFNTVSVVSGVADYFTLDLDSSANVLSY